MGSLRLRVKVSVSGPLADGTADRVLTTWAERTARALADEGVKELRDFPMDKTGRARGGFENALHVVADGPMARIPGPQIRGVAWSPWLEGKSRRNESTGFRGYHLFRKTRLDLQKRAPDTGQRILAELLSELGGDA